MRTGRKYFGLLAWGSLLVFGMDAIAAVDNDFDGDGMSDPAVYESATGNWHIAMSSSNAVNVENWGWAGSRPVCGDFDGDNRADVAVYDRFTSNWFVKGSSGSNNVVQLGLNDARAVPGDYDGDGQTDFAVFQRLSGIWLIQYSSDNSIHIINWGWGGSRPVQADYDGDGRTDIAVFHRSLALWVVLKSSGGVIVKQWGWSKARPVPADYDGDLKADFAVYHRAKGNWYIQSSSKKKLLLKHWGSSKSFPVPGDYDGDGKADLAVYNRTAGTWLIKESDACTTNVVSLGGPDMCALPGYLFGGMQNLVILAFGDSITYGYSSSSGGPETGYPILMERICEPDIGGHCAVINGGRNGEGTEAGRARIKVLLEKYHPDLTLIMEGTNDHFYQKPNSFIDGNLRAMVQSALDSGSSVMIGTIPPVIKSAYRDRSAQEARIVAFNPLIFKIAQSKKIVAVDVWKAITSQPNWQTNLMDQQTANHPNDAGYLVVRDAYYKAVKAATLAGDLY